MSWGSSGRTNLPNARLGYYTANIMYWILTYIVRSLATVHGTS